MGAPSLVRLLRWLTPGLADGRRPPNVRRRSVVVPAARPFEAWLYSPTDVVPSGALLVAPGLHFLGPADPRLDRVLAALASAGLVVLAPFLPDYLALRVKARALDDFSSAFEHLEALPEKPSRVRPGVFSISFGSLPALRLASDPRYAERIGGVVVFGGYADWGETIRFCLTGEVDGQPLAGVARDPLNQPAIFINLLDNFDEKPHDAGRLAAAWMAYMREVWGRHEMKAATAWPPIARRHADAVDRADRELFLIGCGVEPGALALVEAALLERQDAFLDPRPCLSGLRKPIHLVHGRDDDVIPYTQLAALARAIPPHVPCRTYLTGLYAHTGHVGLTGRLERVPGLAREGKTLLAMLSAILRVSTGTRDDPSSIQR